MMNETEIREYLNKLPFTEKFDELEAELQSKLIFAAWETLERKFGAVILTQKMAALQTLYILEGEREEFSKFKRHGLSSVGFDGNSLTFDTSRISPDVQDIIDRINEENDPTKLPPLFGRLR